MSRHPSSQLPDSLLRSSSVDDLDRGPLEVTGGDQFAQFSKTLDADATYNAGLPPDDARPTKEYQVRSTTVIGDIDDAAGDLW